MSTRVRAVHLYSDLLAPLCGPIASCETLYAVDDQDNNRPEWVTCKRCLARLASQLDLLASQAVTSLKRSQVVFEHDGAHPAQDGQDSQRVADGAQTVEYTAFEGGQTAPAP